MAIGAAILFGLLFVFFVPFIYNATMFQCGNPAMACLGKPSGLKSLGYLIFNWGGTYSFELGYYAPPVGNLTTFGVLLTYAFPLIVACVGLLGPKIVRLSKVTRIGFATFGAFVFAMSILFVLSTIPTLVWLAIALLPAGGVMFAYSVNPMLFSLEDEDAAP
jgi:hypothetical protein